MKGHTRDHRPGEGCRHDHPRGGRKCPRCGLPRWPRVNKSNAARRAHRHPAYPEGHPVTPTDAIHLLEAKLQDLTEVERCARAVCLHGTVGGPKLRAGIAALAEALGQLDQARKESRRG